METTVLIADDDPLARELLVEWLRLDDLRVIGAANGPEALDKASAVVPDLILLDVMMPGMDGFEVCRRLRADPRVAEVPVIMITALNDRDSRLQGLEAGADDFLTKPYDGVELRARVKTIARLNRYRRLLAERTKFEWVVEHSEDGYVLLGKDDKILYANSAARAYLGRLSTDLRPIVEPFLELARRQYRPEPAEAWLIWPEPCSTTRYLVRPETVRAGSFWLRVEALELPAQHDAHSLVRLRDETSKIVLKRDMWKFNSLVSHKLRTPMTTILGGLEMLSEELEEASKEELATFVTMATDGARRLKNEVARVLTSLSVSDMARSAAEGFELENLPELLSEIGESLELEGLSMEITGEGDGRRLAISPVAFDLIVREILGNSIKFHPTKTPRVRVRAEEVDGALKLTLGDDGTNVPPELLARVWIPYFQSEKGFSGSVDGMGLGLSVVASLIWGVGGTCRIYNQEDGPGVVVELVIPLALDSGREAQGSDTGSNGTTSSSLPSRKR